MSEDVNTYDEILAAARRFLETPETRQILERVGLNGDLTKAEEKLLLETAAFVDPIKNAGAVHWDFMGFAQVLARRVVAGAIPSVDSPEAQALVRQNARPLEYYSTHPWQMPRNPRDLTPEEFVTVMRELLASPEYMETKKAYDNFVFDENSEFDYDDQRSMLMLPAARKGAMIRRKYGIPMSFQPTDWAPLFSSASDVPDDLRALRLKLRSHIHALTLDSRERRMSSIVEFPGDE